jgi:hypothetical protein
MKSKIIKQIDKMEKVIIRPKSAPKKAPKINKLYLVRVKKVSIV